MVAPLGAGMRRTRRLDRSRPQAAVRFRSVATLRRHPYREDEVVGDSSWRFVARTATPLLAWLVLQAATAAPSLGATTGEPCAIKVSPTHFVETSTTGSIAAVVEVSCDPALAGAPVRLIAGQLWSRCDGH